MVTQTELEFRAQGGGGTQNEKLRDFLKANPNRWIAMPALARVLTETGIGCAVHSRVADCRRRYGMEIEHRGGRKRSTGLCTSEYRYVPAATAVPGATE